MEKTQKVIVFFIVVLFVWTFAIFFMFNSTLSQLTSEVSSLNESVEETETQILLLKQRTLAVEVEEPEDESEDDSNEKEELAQSDECFQPLDQEWISLIEKEFTAYQKTNDKQIGTLCELEDGSYVVSAARAADEGQRTLVAFYDEDAETVQGAAYEFKCPAIFDSLNPPIIEKVEDNVAYFSCVTDEETLSYTLELGEDTPKTR